MGVVDFVGTVVVGAEVDVEVGAELECDVGVEACILSSKSSADSRMSSVSRNEIPKNPKKYTRHTLHRTMSGTKLPLES
jgi:hypothetical protein